MKKDDQEARLRVPKLDDPSPVWSMGLTVEELKARAEKQRRESLAKDDETTTASGGSPETV